ncbi:MAG: hypothetical protein QGI70_04815 [Paracoccaceae bacterium]|jgi:hypothetical protein|nr:hypothetical protein [Paracoccaceae bacterium]
MEYQNGPPLPGHAPAGAHSAIANEISRPQVTVPVKTGQLGKTCGDIGRSSWINAHFLYELALKALRDL